MNTDATVQLADQLYKLKSPIKLFATTKVLMTLKLTLTIVTIAGMLIACNIMFDLKTDSHFEVQFWRNTPSRRMHDDMFVLNMAKDVGENVAASTSLSSKMIAVMVTGQLSRLELVTKLDNIVLHNAKAGHKIDLFVLLDSNVGEIKQTSYQVDYTTMPYIKYNEHQLISYINQKIIDHHMEKMVKVYVILEAPSMDIFAVDELPPINDHGSVRKGQVRTPPKERFDNVMRTFNGIRDCTKWIQEKEYIQKLFYDLIVRLRDDTLALGNMTLDHRYMNIATFAKSGSADGFNDHNYVMDRKYIEIYRSFSEDYYLNKTLNRMFWGNPEHHLLQAIASYRIPARTIGFCNFPLINHRGMVMNNTHWLLHYEYVKNFISECKNDCNAIKNILLSKHLAISL